MSSSTSSGHDESESSEAVSDFSTEHDEVITKKMSVDEIEAKLDGVIEKYKHTKNNPMVGISFEKSSNRYKIRHGDINSSSKSLDVACDKIKKHIEEKNETVMRDSSRKKNENISPKGNFKYDNKHFIIYWNESNPLFDIQHILSLLNTGESSYDKKYSKYSKEITNCIWHKNEYNGYILRELINEKTMYNILLQSNSNISKTLKEDVSNILVKLRKTNQTTINNGRLKLKPKKQRLIDTEDNAYWATVTGCNDDVKKKTEFLKWIILMTRNM